MAATRSRFTAPRPPRPLHPALDPKYVVPPAEPMPDERDYDAMPQPPRAPSPALALGYEPPSPAAAASPVYRTPSEEREAAVFQGFAAGTLDPLTDEERAQVDAWLAVPLTDEEHAQAEAWLAG